MDLEYLIVGHRAASLATSCKVDITDGGATFDLRQNAALSTQTHLFHTPLKKLTPLSGDEFARVFSSQFGPIDYTYGISSASTDFVRILPYSVPVDRSLN